MAETYYGKPCAYGHENENGQVLRYRSSRACVECTRLLSNSPKGRAQSIKWQRENKERRKHTQAIAKRKRQLKAIAAKQEANGSIAP